MQSGNPGKNAKAVNLNPWLYSPHNSRAQGREPRTKTWGFGTQDTPSGPRPPSTASEDTRVPACPPCSHHEKELPSEGTQPHPEEGSLRGEQGGAMGSEQGRGDEMTWEVGTVVNPLPQFASACDCFPLGKETPTQHDSKV